MSTSTDVASDTRLAPSEDVRWRRFDEDLVLVHLQRGEYFALDPIGARMWDLLVSGESPSAVASALVNEYESREGEILRHCIELASDLLRHGLITVQSP
jgi:hypothetical protein